MNKFSKIALSTLLSTTLLSASVVQASSLNDEQITDILNNVNFIIDSYNDPSYQADVVGFFQSQDNFNAYADLYNFDPDVVNLLSQYVGTNFGGLLTVVNDVNTLNALDPSGASSQIHLINLINEQFNTSEPSPSVTDGDIANTKPLDFSKDLAVLPQTQEEIRVRIKAIKESKGSSDSSVNTIAQDSLNALQSKPLYADPSTVTSVRQLPSLQAPNPSTNYMLLTASNSTFGVIDNRVNTFVGTNNIAGGDDEMFTKKGVWAKAMITTAKQKTHGMIEGYNLRQPGGTIGIDAGNDDFLVGAAYSYLYGKVTGKVFGAKDTTRTNLGTLYGMYNFANNIFVSAQAQYGKSTIKKSRPWGDTSGTIARAKTKGTIIAGKLESGYDYAMPFDTNWHLVPTIGISTSAFNVKGYTEDQGTGPSYGKRKVTRTAGLVGLMTKYNLQGTNKFTIIPELHVNMSHAFKTKNKDTIITLVDGVDPLVTPSGKLSKNFYQIGTSLKIIKCSTIEAGLGYDLGLSKKFQSHTGQLNFRYNF